MSEYMFGVGPGWLGKKAAAIARKHDCVLVNHVGPQCKCGYGCVPFECKAAREHWFSTENLGEPFNRNVERAVMAELGVA